jgi:nucleotide-binding universal stress UspA family protein
VYRSVLIPIDGSPASECALEHAAFLARGLETELLLLHVVPDIGVPGARVAGVLPGLDQDAVNREMHRQGELLLACALEHLRDQPLEGFLHPQTRCLIVDAEGCRVSDVILRVARDEAVDLIAIGSRGHSATAEPHSAHPILGHVAERVAHGSRVPVLLVPPALRD